jgi:hypothetical protein
MCTYTFINKKDYFQNKKRFDKYIDYECDADIEITEDSDKVECVEIFVEENVELRRLSGAYV